MKQLRRMATVGALLAAIGTTAEAQVNFVGATEFCWSALGSPQCPVYGNSATLGGLTVNSGSFDVTTNTSGFAAIGGDPDKLGTVSLTNATFNYAGYQLFMKVAFTVPTSSSSSTFASIISGSVGTDPTGGIFIQWNPGSLTGTFDGGSYELFPNNITVTPGGVNQIISGGIFSRVSPVIVPEPATGALLAMGLSLMSMVAVRRRRSV
jgi:hypothetical protein